MNLIGRLGATSAPLPSNFVEGPNGHLKVKAQGQLHDAKVKGIVKQSDTCEDCGSTNQPTVAHHPDYLRPLEVNWLCRPCHRQRHWPTTGRCNDLVIRVSAEMKECVRAEAASRNMLMGELAYEIFADALASFLASKGATA